MGQECYVLVVANKLVPNCHFGISNCKLSGQFLVFAMGLGTTPLAMARFKSLTFHFQTEPPPVFQSFDIMVQYYA